MSRRSFCRPIFSYNTTSARVSARDARIASMVLRILYFNWANISWWVIFCFIYCSEEESDGDGVAMRLSTRGVAGIFVDDPLAVGWEATIRGARLWRALAGGTWAAADDEPLVGWDVAMMGARPCCDTAFGFVVDAFFMVNKLYELKWSNIFFKFGFNVGNYELGRKEQNMFF